MLHFLALGAKSCKISTQTIQGESISCILSTESIEDMLYIFPVQSFCNKKEGHTDLNMSPSPNLNFDAVIMQKLKFHLKYFCIMYVCFIKFSYYLQIYPSFKTNTHICRKTIIYNFCFIFFP